MTSNKGQLSAIQYLRALAALMVVAHHARNPSPWLHNPWEGYSALERGVDVFFVISGFIMYHVARTEPPAEFFKKRLMRVVPLYWFATFGLVLLATRLRPWSIDPALVPHILKSLVFIPAAHPNHPTELWPYLIPGWTLNYEMFFYLVFGLGLAISKPLATVTVVMLGLVTAGLMTTDPGTALRFGSNPIILEFLLGAWIARLHAAGRAPRFAGTLLLVGLVGLLASPLIDVPSAQMIARIVFSGMTVLGATSLTFKVPQIRLLHLLGDASYSIYLTHTFIALTIAERIWMGAPLTGPLQFAGWMVCALVTSAVVGVLTYQLFEKPTLSWLRSNVLTQ